MSAIGIPLFSAAEIARRQNAVRAMMDSRGLAGLLVFGHSGRRRHYQADVYYLTNVAPQHESYLLMPRDGDPVLFVTHYNHLASAKEVSAIPDVRRCDKRPAAQIAREIKARNLAGPIGLVGTFAYQDIDVLRKELPSAGLRDLSAEFRDIRTRKSAEELEFQWKAAAGCDAVIKAFAEAIKPGIEERDLLVLSEEVAWKSGCEPDFLYLNSTSMKNSESCVPNQNISRRKLERGDVINTELTVAYGMYSAQILRPFFLGEPTRDYARLYEVAKETRDRMVAAVKPGVTAQQIHEVSGYIEECGFTAIDGVAHGFGIDLLPPSIRSKSYPPPLPFTLEKDMTLVIQPNPTTHDEKMGVQLGEMLLITESGTKSMHAGPSEAIFCN